MDIMVAQRVPSESELRESPHKKCRAFPFRFMANSTDSALFANMSSPGMDSHDDLVVTLCNTVVSYLERKVTPPIINLYVPSAMVGEISEGISNHHHKETTINACKNNTLTFVKANGMAYVHNDNNYASILPTEEIDHILSLEKAPDFLWVVFENKSTLEKHIGSLLKFLTFYTARVRVIVDAEEPWAIPEGIVNRFDEVLKIN